MSTKFGLTKEILVAVLRVIIVVLSGGMVRPRGNITGKPAHVEPQPQTL